MEEILKIDDSIISSDELREEISKVPDVESWSTGYKYLDKLIGKVCAGDFVVIAGRQKSGKSQYAISMTKNFTELGVNCLWIQAELPYKEFLGRFGTKPPMFYVPRELKVPTLTWIEGRVKEASEKFNVKVVFIDDIGMIADEEMYKHRNAFEIYGQRMLRLKRLAIRQKVAIVTVAHIDKEASKSAGKKGMDTSDIKGTMDIAYRADTLLGVERLMGKNKEKEGHDIIQRMPDLDFVKSNECYINILDSRRTGAKNIRIQCYMDENGFINEYE